MDNFEYHEFWMPFYTMRTNEFGEALGQFILIENWSRFLDDCEKPL